jgi:hypothetical protein
MSVAPVEITDGRGGGCGGGAKSYDDGEKAWSFINNLVLSAYYLRKATETIKVIKITPPKWKISTFII